MRILFQNVNALSVSKQATLVNALCRYDIICMSERNNNPIIGSNNFQHHTCTETPRLGILATNTCNIQEVSIGIIINQNRNVRRNNHRVTIQDTVCQSYVYKVTCGSNSFFIENIYMTPDANMESVDQLANHLDSQSLKFTNYIAGGDLNQNFKKPDARRPFHFSSYSQLIRDYTRVRPYRLPNGRTRTSKTMIDLVFGNSTFRPRLSNARPVNISSCFDHFAVSVDIDMRPPPKFRLVRLPKDPLRRSDFTEASLQSTLHDLEELVVTDENYDEYMLKVKKVLDRHVPVNKPGSFTMKKIWRLPLNEYQRSQIDLKKKLTHAYRITKVHELKILRNHQRNRVTTMLKNARSKFVENRLSSQKSEQGIQKTISMFQSMDKPGLRSNDKPLRLGHLTGVQLVEAISHYYYNRSNIGETTRKFQPFTNLHDSIPLYKAGEHLPPYIDVPKLPKIKRIDDFIKPAKITKTHGPAQISSHVLHKIWPSIRDNYNKCLENQGLNYPLFDQGYYQRSISKSGKHELTSFKDLRPIGILNADVKYILNKHVYKHIRPKLAGLLVARNNYTYLGVHRCIIRTFDSIIDSIYNKKKTILVKYDQSNAYGVADKDILCHLFARLNMSHDTQLFLRSFLLNQNPATTVINDCHGFYVSRPLLYKNGFAQGQIMSDLLFIILTLTLHELENVERIWYMDDANDIISEDCPEIAIDTVVQNENNLIDQCHRAGLCINPDKTEYINFNVPDHVLRDAGLKPTKVSKILGAPFSTREKGICLKPLSDLMRSKLSRRGACLHPMRNYTDNFEIRVNCARKIIFHNIGYLFLLRAYSQKEYDRVKPKIYDLLRATGLRKDTPRSILDQVLGQNIDTLCDHQIICTALKELNKNGDLSTVFDRTAKLRKHFPNGTFFKSFQLIWHDFSAKTRKLILKKKNITGIKNWLKSERKLKPNLVEIFSSYKWHSLKSTAE